MTETCFTKAVSSLFGAIFAASAALISSPSAAQEGIAVPAPTLEEPAPQRTTAVAILAGGCFWGVQGVFQHLKGVNNAVSGYAGGEAATANYEMVGSGTTGHAEAVEITYDPREDQLRQAPADLLLGRARSDAAQPAGAGRRHAVPLGDLPAGRRSRRRSRRPTSPSSIRRGCLPRPIVTKIEPG